MAAMLLIAIFAAPMIAAIPAQGSDGAERFVSYYDQLDVNGKAIFDAMNSADADTTTISVELPIALTIRGEDQEEAAKYASEYIKKTLDGVMVALRMSSPMAFWGWTPSALSLKSDITPVDNTVTITTISYSVGFDNYPLDPDTGKFQGIQKMLDDLNAAVGKFHTDSESVRGKILDINNYLVDLVTYDPNWRTKEVSRYAHDAYGALVDPNHYAVCDGYSRAFLLLCEKEGIESIVVSGTGLINMENHAWNYVKMDNGKWYAIDVTWNDNGKKDNPHFLEGGDTFFSTHHQGVYLRDGLTPYRFNSPAISDTGYDARPASNYETYSWILAAIIVAVVSAALYRYAKGGG